MTNGFGITKIVNRSANYTGGAATAPVWFEILNRSFENLYLLPRTPRIFQKGAL